jgi:hypothetical protein
MAEMDPIIRDAMKRSSQMHGYMPNSHQRQQPEKREEKTSPQKPIQQKKACEEKVEIKEKALEALLKNKEQSLILLLIVLLMNENADPGLLLALMYLLI